MGQSMNKKINGSKKALNCCFTSPEKLLSGDHLFEDRILQQIQIS